MKIIQHGRPETVLSSVKRFKCDSCGCVFEAEKDEYITGSQYNNIFYQCKCPECGKTANEMRMQGAV